MVECSNNISITIPLDKGNDSESKLALLYSCDNILSLTPLSTHTTSSDPMSTPLLLANTNFNYLSIAVLSTSSPTAVSY